MAKWSANNIELLSTLDDHLHEGYKSVNLVDTVTTLGLKWTPGSDEFSFAVDFSESVKIISKRSILSETSKLFDHWGGYRLH